MYSLEAVPLPPVPVVPAVHIIIVNWNSEALLRRCLDALSGQTYSDFAVTVVDNGSAHFDADALSAYFAERSRNPLSCLPLPRNEGFAAANNHAVAALGDATWIALLNPDAFPEPAWLERLLTAARERPDCASFASRLIQANAPDRLDGAGDAYHVSGLVWRRGHGEPAAGRYLAREEVFSACAAAALYRGDALRAAGGFDDAFGSYVEDVDLGFRLRLAGHRCLYVPDAVAHHVGSAVSGPRSDAVVYLGHRNLVWCYAKNMPGVLAWVLLPAHLAMTLVAFTAYLVQGRGRVLWRAKRDAWRGLGDVLRRRRAVQATRRVRLRDLWPAFTKRLS